jgi:hypothetical protein
MKENKGFQEHNRQPSSIPEEKGHGRRTFVVRTIVSLLGGSLVGYGGTTPARAQTKSSFKEEELAPFKKIAKEKGVKLAVLRNRKEQLTKMSEMHLDMDMVRASLENAISRSKKQGLSSIQAKLERLRLNGTAAQQIDFVLGSGRQYVFPEDLERLALKAEEDKFYTFGVVCGTFCWLACVCTGQFNQECRERCRDIICPK